MAPQPLIWKIPERWNAMSLCDRTAVYPALYLRRLGFQTAIKRQVFDADLAGGAALVMVIDGELNEQERDLARSAQALGLTIVFCPQNGIAEGDRDYVSSCGVVALQMEDGPLASAPPNDPVLQTVSVPVCGAGAIEDARLAGELQASSRSSVPGARLKGNQYIVILATDSHGLSRIEPIRERWAAKQNLQLVVAVDESLLPERPSTLPNAIMMSVRDPGLLEVIAGAEVFACFDTAAKTTSPRPAQWVRTGLKLGVPVVASSHPSIDGMADLCICDDWERGLSLYLGSSFERAKAAIRAHARLADSGRPDRIARRWADILRDAKTGGRPARQKGARKVEPDRLLVTLLDLPQDIDLVLPVLLAVRERGALRQRILVTDWLQKESPRTFGALADVGLEPEIIPRAAARQGEFPSLADADAALSACDSTASPHKIGYAFARKAGSLGLASFTIQHGFENVGLNYRDRELDAGVRFGSGRVFVWFPGRALEAWVSPATHSRLVYLGCPKLPPPPAPRLPSRPRWKRVVGIFENLHWRRYDDDFRRCLLSDLEDAAAANPNVLFLVKPHHAGRWFHLNRSKLQGRANVLIIDPTDPEWQPYTAPALITAVDAVLTTPSTVAMDAARAGRPVAVLGYNLDLPLYAPLPIVRTGQDWSDFLAAGDDGHFWCNEAFLSRALLPGCAHHRIAAHIENALEKRRIPAAA